MGRGWAGDGYHAVPRHNMLITDFRLDGVGAVSYTHLAAVIGDHAVAHVEKEGIKLVAFVFHGLQRRVQHGRHVVERGGQNADLVLSLIHI